MNVIREPETEARQGFWKKENLKITPQKILLIGTLGSGKTTVAQRLAQDTGFRYASIDGCRIRYGDGTAEGEERAWEHFLAICREPAPGILECCGLGPRVEEIRDELLCSTVPVSVIWLVLPLETCIARASQRQKKIPSPYQWAPVEYSVPLIHEGIVFAWEIIWSRESYFHTTRQDFSGADSVDEMYSAVREICVMRGERTGKEHTGKIALTNAMTRESKITDDDITALDHKVKAGIQEQYKSKVSRNAGRNADRFCE